MHQGYVSEIFTSFQGEGLFAGRRHLFLRMAGCNLRCAYCDTPESLERTPACTIEEESGAERTVANPIGVAALRQVLERRLHASSGLHALAITGGEPLLQAEFLAELLASARPPLPVLLETNGTYPERLKLLLPYLGIVSMDLKLPSNSGEAPCWERHREFLEAATAATLYVKVPVDDGTADEEVARAAALVAAVAPSTPFFLQPIVSPDSELRASASRLGRFYDLAARLHEDVRVLPQAHKVLGVR